MLYLNRVNTVSFIFKTDLTLTSVVFECELENSIKYFALNLTLTSVVFELVKTVRNNVKMNYLTLTSVVFE